jgi:hypothetical protein
MDQNPSDLVVEDLWSSDPISENGLVPKNHFTPNNII